jgi:hypothetical protein
MRRLNLWCEQCQKEKQDVELKFGQDVPPCSVCESQQEILWNDGGPKWQFSLRQDKNPTGRGTPRHSNRSKLNQAG